MLCFLGAVHIDVVRVRGHVTGGTAVAPLAAVDVTSTGKFLAR